MTAHKYSTTNLTPRKKYVFKNVGSESTASLGHRSDVQSLPDFHEFTKNLVGQQKQEKQTTSLGFYESKTYKCRQNSAFEMNIE